MGVATKMCNNWYWFVVAVVVCCWECSQHEHHQRSLQQWCVHLRGPFCYQFKLSLRRLGEGNSNEKESW